MFVLDGEMSNYLLPKGLILNIIGAISTSSATYFWMEFVGTTVECLSMEEMMALSNMVIDVVRKNVVVAVDMTTYKYLRDMTLTPYELVFSDENGRFLIQYRFNVSKMEPLVPKQQFPDNHTLWRKYNKVKMDRIDIGSCIAGKIEDFMLQQILSLW